MASAAPMRKKRRGIWIILVALPLGAWFLANLWLASSQGCQRIAAKIQNLTGLEARIGRVSITPWNGLSIYRLELLQPAPLRAALSEPFARIQTFRCTPVWQTWLHGKPEMRITELDSSQWVIPLELLADLAKSQAPAVSPSPPLATITPVPAPATAVSPTPPIAGGTAPASVAAASTSATPDSPPKAPAVNLPPTAWLHLKNASFTVVSAASDHPWCRMSGLDAAIPMSGKPAQSILSIRSIHLAGNEYLTNLTAQMDWQSPLLSLSPTTTDIRGFKLVFAAKLAFLAGFPLQIEAQIPRQVLTSFPLPSDGHAAAESIAANARFRGFLFAPGSWQGECIANVLASTVHIGGHDATFDRGSAVVILQSGMLSCLDARLIGDDFSLLGNATLLADGRAAAALRMIAAPEIAASVTRRAFPNMPQPPSFSPLSSPQRTAWDLEAFGNIGRMFLRFGKDGPVVDLTPLTPPP